MRVEWSQTAADELNAIHARLAETSHDYADRMIDRLTRRAAQIALFPNSGRVVPEFGLPRVREMIEGPYRVIYRVETQRVEILAVFHGARAI